MSAICRALFLSLSLHTKSKHTKTLYTITHKRQNHNINWDSRDIQYINKYNNRHILLACKHEHFSGESMPIWNFMIGITLRMEQNKKKHGFFYTHNVVKWRKYIVCVCTVCGCTLLMSVIFCKWHRKNQHVHTSFGLTLYIQCSHLLLLYINLFAFSSFFCFFFHFLHAKPCHAMCACCSFLSRPHSLSLPLTLFQISIHNNHTIDGRQMFFCLWA